MTARPAGPQVVELSDEPIRAAAAADVPEADVAEHGGLPLGRLGALAGSGGFAVWTSLTCFVC